MLNINNEYINTGFSFSSRDNNKVKDKIKKYFSGKNIKYKILLLDTNHDLNNKSLYDNYELNYQTVYAKI